MSLFSELKELLEKQTEMILNIQAKLEEYSEQLKLNKTELEKSKWENAKLREELGHQNAKFEDVFETLQKEDRDIVHSLAKQKVDFDGFLAKLSNQEEVLDQTKILSEKLNVNLNSMNELVKEEASQNKNVTANLNNSIKTVDAKLDDVNNKLVEIIAKAQTELKSKIEDSLASLEVRQLPQVKILKLMPFFRFSPKLKNL